MVLWFGELGSLQGSFRSTEDGPMAQRRSDFMKIVSTIVLVSVLAAVPGLAGSGLGSGFPLHHVVGSAAPWSGKGLFLIALEEKASAGEEPSGKPAPKDNRAANAAMETELKKRVAQSRKELEVLTRKIAADHAQLEAIEKQMGASRKKVAELQASLESERTSLEKMERAVTRIEKGHNDDHDKAEALEKQLADREQALKKFEANQDTVTKLEKRAADLLREADELRKRAEELKKK